MKNVKFLMMVFLAVIISNLIHAQDSSPVEYMNQITSKYKTIQSDMWAYTSAVAHGKSAKKVEAKRAELIQTTFQALSAVKRLPGYEGETAFRDSVVSFLNIYYLILKEDYAKIVDMEEISERSYNDMEAYMTAKEVANDKMNDAAVMVGIQQRVFAEKYKITLLQADDDLTKNMNKADEVYTYYNVLYLVFFKSYMQEKYMIEAITAKDVSAMEQNKSALITTANEGIEKLKLIEAFNSDNTVAAACLAILTFYKDEAENKMPLITDYFIKTENFNTIKKSFDAIKPNSRTQADVDGYNNAVNEMNAAVGVYNSTNEQMTADRTKYIEGWNTSSSKFTDKHVPKGK